MTILDKIVARKKEEVAQSKQQVTEAKLQASPLFNRVCYSLKESIADPNKSGIIAEYKRASPSKGLINGTSTVKDVVSAYQQAGAVAISVLTDTDFFQGTMDDLIAAREVLTIPLLRKEFIVDPYQITQAKAYGADIILLIAACLTPEELKSMATYAKSLGLNILLEIHNEQELNQHLDTPVDAIGVNNRNLKDFSVSLAHSYDLVNKIPNQYIKVSESGISDPKTIHELKQAGFDAFLIGENFMKTTDPGQAIQSFVQELRNIK